MTKEQQNTFYTEKFSLDRTPPGQVISIVAGSKSFKLRLDDDISISFSSDYGPLVGNKTNDLFTVLSANISVMKDLGLSGQNKYLGYQIWKKTQPIEVSLTAYMFVDEHHSAKGLLSDLKQLLKIVVPKEKTTGNLAPPGPSLVALFTELSTKIGTPGLDGKTTDSSGKKVPPSVDTSKESLLLFESIFAEETKKLIDRDSYFNTIEKKAELERQKAQILSEMGGDIHKFSDSVWVTNTIGWTQIWLFKERGSFDSAVFKLSLARWTEESKKLQKAKEDSLTTVMSAIAGSSSKNEIVSIYIGGYLQFESVVVTKAQPVFSSITDTEGPVSIQVQLEFKSIVTATNKEVTKLFIYPHNLHKTGITV